MYNLVVQGVPFFYAEPKSWSVDIHTAFMRNLQKSFLIDSINYCNYLNTSYIDALKLGHWRHCDATYRMSRVFAERQWIRIAERCEEVYLGKFSSSRTSCFADGICFTVSGKPYSQRMKMVVVILGRLILSRPLNFDCQIHILMNQSAYH